MSDATEPAIPIRAVVPVQAYADILALAETELGSLARTGLRVAIEFTEAKDARVLAVLTVQDLAKGMLDVGAFVTREFSGRYAGGAYLQWTAKG